MRLWAETSSPSETARSGPSWLAGSSVITWPSLAAAVRFQDDVAARLELEVVERSLEAEASPVHRGGEGNDRPLEIAPQVAVLLELAVQLFRDELTRPRCTRR